VPARVGNAATTQFQLDILGEVVDALHYARRIGLEADEDAWRVEGNLVEFVESAWQEPDEGIWEVRGPRRPFTHSKVMAWVALDRAVKAVERWARGPVERWHAVRATIHNDAGCNGFDRELGAFVSTTGRSTRREPSDDSARGFLPATDRACHGRGHQGTSSDGLVARYQTTPDSTDCRRAKGPFCRARSGS
jgi:GH15 family glucan-1,4-alpha-glucosidase